MTPVSATAMATNYGSTTTLQIDGDNDYQSEGAPY